MAATAQDSARQWGEGDASRPGKVEELVFVQVLEGRGGDAGCFSVCWAAASSLCPRHQHGGCRQAGGQMPPFAGAGMVFPWMWLGASPVSPALPPAALPMGLALGTHPGTHLGTRRRGCPGVRWWHCHKPQLCKPGCGWPWSHMHGCPWRGSHATLKGGPRRSSSPAVCWPHPLQGLARRGPALGWGSSPTTGSSKEGLNHVQQHPIAVSSPPTLFLPNLARPRSKSSSKQERSPGGRRLFLPR